MTANGILITPLVMIVLVYSSLFIAINLFIVTEWIFIHYIVTDGVAIEDARITSASKRVHVDTTDVSQDEICRSVIMLRLKNSVSETALDKTVELINTLLHWIRNRLPAADEKSARVWLDAFTAVEAVANSYRRSAWIQKFSGIKPVC